MLAPARPAVRLLQAAAERDAVGAEECSRMQKRRLRLTLAILALLDDHIDKDPVPGFSEDDDFCVGSSSRRQVTAMPLIRPSASIRTSRSSMKV